MKAAERRARLAEEAASRFKVTDSRINILELCDQDVRNEAWGAFKESLAKSEMLAVGFGQHTRSFQSRLYVSNEKYEMKTAPPLRTRPVVEFTPKPPIPTERPELDAWLASFGAAPRPPPWHAPSPPSRPASARVRPTTPRAVNARPSSASRHGWLKPASTLSRPASAGRAALGGSEEG